MKNFLRIGLPIILVFAVVFVITLAQRYTSDTEDENDNGAGPTKPVTARKAPLRFAQTQVSSGYADASLRKDAPNRYWNASVEIGQPGSYEFLCQNPNDQPVTINVHYTSCQCVGTHLGIIPHDAWRDYVQLSALSGSGLANGPLTALAAHVQFSQQVKWEVLKAATENSKEVVNNTLTLPAADPVRGPQLGFVRLGWTGKTPAEPKLIWAEVFASLPDQPVANTKLEANIITVSPFAVFKRDAEKGFAMSIEAALDDLREGGVTSRDVYLLSASRANPVYTISVQGDDPCITASEAKPASAEELASFESFLRNDPKMYRAIKSLYKFTITARERVEREGEGKKVLRQLDLGLLERRISINCLLENSEPSTITILARGRVYGELTVATGADTGRIELGNSFPANEDRSKDVTIIAERSGLDIKLLKDETTPNYLQVSLDPLDPVDGRKRWRVRVTVPKNRLFGPLPINSGIVLETLDAAPRRIRIPIRGMSADTGGRPDL